MTLKQPALKFLKVTSYKVLKKLSVIIGMNGDCSVKTTGTIYGQGFQVFVLCVSMLCVWARRRDLL